MIFLSLLATATVVSAAALLAQRTVGRQAEIVVVVAAVLTTIGIVFGTGWGYGDESPLWVALLVIPAAGAAIGLVVQKLSNAPVVIVGIVGGVAGMAAGYIAVFVALFFLVIS